MPALFDVDCEQSLPSPNFSEEMLVSEARKQGRRELREAWGRRRRKSYYSLSPNLPISTRM